MGKSRLKAGIVYVYDGSGGADGATILFTVKEDESYDYHGSIVLHWKGNRVNIQEKPNGSRITKYHIPKVRMASEKAVMYYNECAKVGYDVGGYTWHNSVSEFD
jgi:hypothetical protein